MRFVLFGREQRVRFSRVRQFNFIEPAAGVRLGVDQGRVVHHGLVHFEDLAAHWRIDITRGLHRLHHRARVTRLHCLADLRQLHEHHVRQFMLSMVGDADGGIAAGDTDPFVRLRVLQIRGNVGTHNFERRLRGWSGITIHLFVGDGMGWWSGGVVE